MLNRLLCAFYFPLHRKDARSLFVESVVFTLFWGLLAHAYALLNPLFSHDSAYEFQYPDAWKIQLGRFFGVLYTHLAIGSMTLPWLGGLLGLLWITLAVFLTAQLFQTPKRSTICLLSAVFTTNITVIGLLATYNQDFGADMFALLLATVAGYWWYRSEGYQVLWGSLFVFVSLGLYQSYFSVTVVYLMLASIMALLRQQSTKQVLSKGFWGIAMLLLGGLLYCVALRLVPIITGISIHTGGYNTLDVMNRLSFRILPIRLVRSYLSWGYNFLILPSGFSPWLMRLAHLALGIISFRVIVRMLFKADISRSNKALVLLLGMLLPLGMNLTYLLSGFAHDLMIFSFWFLYVLVLLLVEWANIRKASVLAIVCLLLIVWGNVQSANGAYLVKDLQQDSVKALLVQIETDLAKQGEYSLQETPVVFVGRSELIAELDWKYHDGITGVQYHPFGYYGATVGYCQKVMGLPIVFCDRVTWEIYQTDPRTADMPCYPREGSIQRIDDVFVVKLGEVSDG